MYIAAYKIQRFFTIIFHIFPYGTTFTVCSLNLISVHFMLFMDDAIFHSLHVLFLFFNLILPMTAGCPTKLFYGVHTYSTASSESHTSPTTVNLNAHWPGKYHLLNVIGKTCQLLSLSFQEYNTQAYKGILIIYTFQ